MQIRQILLATSLLALFAAGHAHAQETTLELGDDGAWVETDRPEPGTIEYRLSEIRRELAQDRPDRARSLAERLVNDLDETNPWYPSARLIFADAKAANGREFRALFDYEEVISRFPATPEYRIAVERELEIAIDYARGRKRRVFWGLFRIGSATSLAEELLIRVQERLPGSSAAERAGIELADFYFRDRDMHMAAEAYEMFMTLYPESVHRKRAMQRRILANIARFKGPRYDASGLIEAEALIDEFKGRFPLEAEETGVNDALLARLDESRGAQLLENAQWYLRRGDDVSGKYTLRRLIAAHPRSVAAVRARTIMEQNGWQSAPIVEQTPIGPIAEPPTEEQSGDGS